MSKVLVIAPHADDEVLGVGGTISRLSLEGHKVVVAILTGHGEVPHPIWPKDIWDIVRAEALEENFRSRNYFIPRNTRRNGR
jgi:LmbE family N-acetylglucosaminyl deacetylase